MHRRPRRFARRFAALAPVLAALGGQALAAGSLRVPFLPHVGTTPAPSFDPSDPATADGLATLRRAAAAAGRHDLEARTLALFRALGVPTDPARRPETSSSDDIRTPGPASTSPGSETGVRR